MKRVSLYLVIATVTSASAIGAPIHDAVRSLDFAKVEKQVKDGNVNLPEGGTGLTPLAIAVQNALPKDFEAKAYPFDKQTFMFMKKVLTCGLKSSTALIAKTLLDNPNGNALLDEALITDGQDPNKASNAGENCDGNGECKKGQAQASEEPACLTQLEINSFISKVKKDAPNSVTAVGDILSAGMDFLFDKILFYEDGVISPEVKMVKLLVANNAEIHADLKQSIGEAGLKSVMSANSASRQAFIRLAGDGALFFIEVAVGAYASGYVSQSKLHYPMNLMYFGTGVKALIDLRNTLAALVHQVSSGDRSDNLVRALEKQNK